MPRDKPAPRHLVEAAPIVVRVRTNQRTERVTVRPQSSWIGFKELVYAQAGCSEQQSFLSSDASGTQRIQANDLTSLLDLEITNGSLLYLVPERGATEGSDRDENKEEAQQSKKRPRKKKEATVEEEKEADKRQKHVNEAGDEPIVGSFAGLPDVDVNELARDYLSPDAASTTGELGASLFQQRLAAARAGAIIGGGVSVSVTNGGKRLAVSFRDKTSGKAYQEECPLYSHEQIRDVLFQVVVKRTTRRRRAAAAMNESIFTVAEMAHRSPPFLWSIYAGNKGDVNHGIRMILDEVQEKLRTETETQASYV